MTVKDNEIKKLSDYTHIRLRAEMYLSSRQPHTQEVIIYDERHKPTIKEVTYIPALFCAFREVWDNALDEISLGHGSRLDVTYDKDTHDFSVRDYGRGIPITPVSKTDDTPLATMVLTNSRAGRNFGERGQQAGTNGIGVFSCVAVSKRSSVSIWRDKKLFTQTFAEHDEELMIEFPKIKRDKNATTGTKITVTPSEKVFHGGLIMPEEFLYSRIFDIALANPTIQVFYNGKRIRVRPASEKTLFPNDDTVYCDIREGSFRSRFILKPNFREKGEMVHSIVNNIPAFNGGSHIDAFTTNFYSGLIKSLSSQSKRRKLTLHRNDINDGLLIYNITTMDAPDFDSQSKTRLINEDVGKIVKTYFEDEKLFKDIIRKNPEWVESIYTKCAERTQKKDNKDIAKLAKQTLRGRVPDLLDATGKIRRNCILILGEGDCLHEDTELKILHDSVLMDIPLKSINVGDIVLTHNNNFKPVLSVSKKVVKGKRISLHNHDDDIICSEEHRWLIYNKTTMIYEFIKTKNIDSTIHQMVKSRVINFDVIEEVVDKITNDTYGFEIIYGNDSDNYKTVYSSLDHKFVVFDLISYGFIMLPASDIDPTKHALVGKYV